MRKLGVWIAGFVLIAIGATAGAGESAAAAQAKAVEARSRAWIRTALEGNAQAFLTFASDNYVLLWIEPASGATGAHWVASTKREWADQIASKAVRYDSVDIYNLRIHVDGELATIAGEYRQTGVRAGKAFSEQGLFTETWAKRRGEWIAVSSVFP